MPTDKDIAKLAASLTKSLATKEDVNSIKIDVNGIRGDVNDIREDVNGIRGDVNDIREDVNGIRGDILDIKEDISEVKVDIKHLENKVGEVDDKVDQVLKYADAIEETTSDHEKRIKKLERVSSVS